MFSGKIYAKIDYLKRPIIDSDIEAFKDMLEYIRLHRTWLPSKKGPKIKRDLAETEIRKWGVDKGLAQPSVLTTNIAREF